MFRIEVFVDDKKLGNALHALVGLTLGDPKVQPVANAVVKNGKVGAASVDLAGLFAKFAKERKLGSSQFSANVLREFCKYAGMSETSYGYAGKQLLKAGAIKKHGAGTKSAYTVAK